MGVGWDGMCGGGVGVDGGYDILGFDFDNLSIKNIKFIN